MTHDNLAFFTARVSYHGYSTVTALNQIFDIQVKLFITLLAPQAYDPPELGGHGGSLQGSDRILEKDFQDI